MATTKTPNTPAIAATFFNARGEECGVTEAGPTGIMRLTYSDGAELSLTTSQLTSDICTTAIWHGLKQKLVDAAAISRDPETGRAATIATKQAAVREVFERLLAGEWNKRRESGATGGLLLTALVRMYDGRKTRADIEAFLATKTDAEKAALRGNSKVAAIIEEIKAERAKADGANGADLLAELDGEE